MNDDAHTPGGHADSAGVPWAGRSFHHNPAADDDGRADPRLIEALRRFHTGEVGPADVVEAAHHARLLVPLIAVAGDEGIGVHGQQVDKTQELSLVTLEGPEGRAVIPAFTSVGAMSAWNSTARPIPVEGPRVAFASASEGSDAIILDPGSPTEFAIRRTAFRALATGAPWIPSFADPALRDSFWGSIADEPVVHAVQLAPGDPQSRLAGPELLVQLSLEPGLDGDGLHSLLFRLQEKWTADELIAERVDSIALRLDRIAG